MPISTASVPEVFNSPVANFEVTLASAAGLKISVSPTSGLQVSVLLLQLSFGKQCS